VALTLKTSEKLSSSWKDLNPTQLGQQRLQAIDFD
jgi:hypothetical protein